MCSIESPTIPGPAEYSWEKHLQARWNLVAYLKPDLLRNPDVISLRAWIKEGLDSLPEMDVTRTDLSDGQVWQAVLTPDGKNVSTIVRADGAFFALEGRKAKKTFINGDVFEWNQPVIISKEQPMSIPTPEGSKTLPVHGFLGVIPDTKGDVLLRIDQELMSENEKQAGIMLAIQASVSKISLILEGNANADKSLTSLLAKLSGGEIANFMTKPDTVIPIVSEDPSREFKHNLLLAFQPVEADSPLHEELVADRKHRWCSRAEIDALALARLTNGHTLSAIRTWEALVG